ncbi:MAG: ECF transporter S component [Clostridiales bacterium]|nr:ECF transporter S component [Clostridiales bacterium]
MKHEQTKKLTVLAMLCAVAFAAVAVARIPVIAFLKYEPKDVIVTFGGFLYGPLSALAVSTVVSFLEMLTISDTGWIGLIMNILSTAAFACTAALIYRKVHTLHGAVIGLVLSTVLMTAVMLLWNYVLTPFYLGTPRADVAAMLLPVFLPFNLIKGGLNTAITILLYRPVVQGLRRAGLFPESTSSALTAKKSKIWVWSSAVSIIAICIVLILCFQGVLS